uniref:Uncharacterized protein n=1 Tax=Utricularia reniformis TaxID=192314 RepID=A0A1Y0AZD4_9LAMI|nr:hypothetical protein AEK19_MT0211 [Utricularia reniformis]ART30489.1 hypothetical protein AEK19_MT0211 [Utricularia reniformis]
MFYLILLLLLLYPMSTPPAPTDGDKVAQVPATADGTRNYW